MAWATTKRFASIQIVDPATNKPAPNCEMLLLAKDGVYVMQVGCGCAAAACSRLQTVMPGFGAVGDALRVCGEADGRGKMPADGSERNRQPGRCSQTPGTPPPQPAIHPSTAVRSTHSLFLPFASPLN